MYGTVYIYLHVVDVYGSKALFREFLGALQVIQMVLQSTQRRPQSHLTSRNKAFLATAKRNSSLASAIRSCLVTGCSRFVPFRTFLSQGPALQRNIRCNPRKRSAPWLYQQGDAPAGIILQAQGVHCRLHCWISLRKSSNSLMTVISAVADHPGFV